MSSSNIGSKITLTCRLACLSLLVFTANSFTVSPLKIHHPAAGQVSRTVCHSSSAPPTHTEYKGFGLEQERKDSENEEAMKLSSMQNKERLLDLLPRMMGTPQELKQVEAYVNALEAKYTPAQTLDFLNLAMGGEWQLLFSTNRLGLPKPQFRLREMYQKVSTVGLQGSITNNVQWEYAQQENEFDVTGTFSVKCGYNITQGARMVVALEDHVLQLLPGSKVPSDVPALVGMIHRAMPTEMFDPNDHAMDTTYLDGDLRIVRMTGPQHEGVRDIFIRRGSLEINLEQQDSS